MIYLLTAIGLTPGGSSTVHIYTQTIRRTTQSNQYIEQHKNFGSNTKILGTTQKFWEQHKNLGKKHKNLGNNTKILETIKRCLNIKKLLAKDLGPISQHRTKKCSTSTI
jgi:hypothetical protein